MNDKSLNEDRLRTWRSRFGNAFHGIKKGVRGESSFLVHFFASAVVILAGFILRVSSTEWCLLIICITGVLAAEMFNTSLERMAKLVDRNYNPSLGEALDVASAAVLITATGAAVTGGIIFLTRLAAIFAEPF